MQIQSLRVLSPFLNRKVGREFMVSGYVGEGMLLLTLLVSFVQTMTSSCSSMRARCDNLLLVSVCRDEKLYSLFPCCRHITGQF